MKKLMTLCLVLTMAFSLTACGDQNGDTVSNLSTEGESLQHEEEIPKGDAAEDKEITGSEVQDGTSENGTEESNISQTSEPGSNILIAYFSRVGNTEWEEGVDVTTSASLNIEGGEYYGNAQLLALMAQEATGGDLFLIETVDSYPSDYRETTDQAAEEQNRGTRPALASHVENMDSYDTIILIYPNWWGTLPQPLFTFLEEYDFSGKAILPLCTHGGSRMGSSEKDIAALCPDANLLSGLAISGSNAAAARSEVEEWINSSL